MIAPPGISEVTVSPVAYAQVMIAGQTLLLPVRQARPVQQARRRAGRVRRGFAALAAVVVAAGLRLAGGAR